MLLRLALIQTNPTVGDLRGNLAQIDASVRKLIPLGPDLLIYPELAMTGYPPEDLLLYRRFLEETALRIQELAALHPSLRLIVGTPWVEQDEVYNAAVLLHGGKVVHTYYKCTLPNYGVFDEKRYFRAGRRCPVYRLGEWRIGLSICEDIWAPRGVPAVQAEAGANVLINISSSPYSAGKGEERIGLIRHRARQYGTFLAYVNLVGGQDELVFDGRSLVVDPTGDLLMSGPMFQQGHLVVDLDATRPRGTRAEKIPFVQPRYEEIAEIEDELRAEPVDLSPADSVDRPPLPPHLETDAIGIEEEIYGALVLGTHDYVRKNGFEEVVIGLSGGIDSALTATIAVDALGKKGVHGLSMPSRYTSSESREGIDALVDNLGIDLIEIDIERLRFEVLEALAPSLGRESLGVTEENLQARIRGNLLMAFSNHRGWLVLTTGNKSELAVGYCTLYGDMAGGFAVLKDVPKQLVYRLARWRNGHGRELIPTSTIERPPSAELRADQKDSDTLPPYDILDPIIEARVEREDPPEAVIARGFDPDLVRRIYRMIDGNEYKRRQGPPGIKITPRAFGRDRRYPITNRYQTERDDAR